MKRLLLSFAVLIVLAIGARAQSAAFVPSCAGVNDTAKFTAIKTAVGTTTPATIKLTYGKTCKFTSSFTLTTSNITLDGSDGGLIELANGVVLTIQGPVTLPARKIFVNATAGLGTVSFSGNKVVNQVYAEYWGAGVGVAAATNAAALNAANAALVTIGSGEIVLAGSGFYDFNLPVTLGTTGTFTGISLAGTNGLVGTTLNWTGSTSGVALHIKLGRYNHIHDLMFNNAVAKGTTIGLEVDGNPGGGGGQTFFADFSRITIRGFHVNMQVGIDADTSTADLLTLEDMSLEGGDVGLKAQGLGGLTNLTLLNVNVSTNATYGVWLNDTACQVNWFGGAFGSNGISFYNDAQAACNLHGIRDEYSGIDWQFYVQPNGSVPITLHVSNLMLAPNATPTLNKPAITVYNGTVEIDHSFFGSTTNHVIPFGTTSTDGVGNGVYTSLFFHDNVVNENVPLFQYNSTTQSAFNGMKYRLVNNLKVNDANASAGPWPDRVGQIVWPNMVDVQQIATGLAYTPFTPSQITANQNNYSPVNDQTALAVSAPTYLRLRTDASRNITGLTFNPAQIDGQTVTLINFGSFNIVLKYQDGASTAANRFLNTIGEDLTLAPNEQAICVYDATSARWRVSKENWGEGTTGSGNVVLDNTPTLITPIFTTSASSPLWRSTVAKVLLQGTGTGATQISSTQTTPPTCSSNCGTSSSVAGSDSDMRVTMGATGSPTSGFVVTFNGTWAAAPVCSATMSTAGMVVGKLPLTVVTTTTTITVVTNGTNPANSDTYAVMCRGIQ